MGIQLRGNATLADSGKYSRGPPVRSSIRSQHGTCTDCPMPMPCHTHYFFLEESVRESQSRPSYKPSPVVAQALWMNHCLLR
eukprot:CAMPEP_0183403476 /NCGR_PEP_ID=MMETSP0370-20130417/14604_1 /TAXON_ID=268820 /ORGANISM="Peridinium aciculiferum, Strain PAER-2" /LENGTH=81 /DNA_ID=CAMNT_0025585233 /DNA_START=70 /DNA_END=312 /DNA_ORIENTATION=+